MDPISAWSGLPEPENPTGFGRFSWTRMNPNPKEYEIAKPEETRTRTLNPRVPENLTGPWKFRNI